MTGDGQFQSVTAILHQVPPGWTIANPFFWAVIGNVTLGSGTGPYVSQYKRAAWGTTKPVSFNAFGTDNYLYYTYDIVSPDGTWSANASYATSPFTINLYASPDGSLDDVESDDHWVKSYYVGGPSGLTGTAGDNEFTVQIPTTAIDAALLGSVAAQDQYLVGDIVFDDGSPSIDVRFQGGAFQNDRQHGVRLRGRVAG